MITQPIPTQVSPTPVLHSVRVLKSESLTPTSHMIRVAKPSDFVFTSSQAARIHLPTINGTEFHTLSIASSPTRDYLQFAVRRSPSAWKQAFFALKPGDEVQIEGPRGRFFLDTERSAILIAGGIGITPFQGMIDYATDAGLTTNIMLLCSNRVPSEIAFNNELDEMANRNKHLEIIYTITRHSLHEPWNGRRGRIDEDLIRQVSQNKPDAIYYICGTPSLVNDTVQMLHNLGIPPERIHLETFKGYAKYAIAPQV
jgi:ferredoxin-NADP reductase